MKPRSTAAVMVAGIVASFLLAVLAFVATFFLCMILFKGTTALWVTYVMVALGFSAAIATVFLGVRTSWRYSQGRVAIPHRGNRRFEITILLAIAGALSGGGLMLGSIFVLGHMRPMWMELSDVIPAAIAGSLVGSAVGVLLGFTHRST